jgi:hypothetical protein
MEVVAKIHLPPPTLFHIAPFYPTEKKTEGKKPSNKLFTQTQLIS